MKERSKGRVLGALAVLAAALSCGEQGSAPREDVARATMALGGLRVQYHHGEDTSATNGDIKPYFRIMNDSSTSVPLSELTLRYFYTREGTSAESSSCWWAQIGCGNINRSNPALTPARSGADHVFEISFKTSAGNLAGGANTGEIKVGFHKNDWSAYSENGDFSYVASQTQWADAPNVALYRNGSLVWGSEPGGGGGTGGTSGQGGTAQGGTAHGGTAQGGTAQGGTAQGGTAQGGTAQGGTAQGGTAQGGTAQGGTPQGGTAQGGTAQGGTVQGGTTGGTGGSGGTNVALNKPAAVSTEQSGTPSSYANDSDTASSRWCAAVADTGRWWQVDLGVLHAVTGTQLRWPDARIYRYAISVSTDGSTWQEVVNKRSNTSSAQVQRDTFVTSARYVRIAITGLPYGVTAACLVDFEVFGAPSEGGSGGTPSTGGVPAIGGSTPAGGSGGTTGGTAGQGGTAATAGTGASGGTGGTGTSAGGAPVGGTGTTGGSAGTGGNSVEFFFKLPYGVRRGDVTFATTGGDLRIADGVDVTNPGGFSSVSSVDGGAVARIGVGVDVQNVWSDGPVQLANQAHVHGSLVAQSGLDPQPGSLIDGATYLYRNFTPLQEIRWNVDFPATNQGPASLEPGQTRSIAPGAYAASTINRDAHLTLGSGTYFFDSLTIETSGYLDINNSNGPVFIYMRNGFTFRGTVTRTAAQPNILFGVAGANAIPIEGTFYGILVAPWAQVTLGTQAGQYHGSFFAKSIESLATTVAQEPLQPAQFCAAGSPCSAFCACGPNTPGCTSSDQCDGVGCSTNGVCGCEPQCAGKQCGDDLSDGCGGQCTSVCTNGQTGCTYDVHCPAGSYCQSGGGSTPGTNVCRPLVCRLQDPHLPDCGVGTADCGPCPACVPDCEGKQCGPDSCGSECGSTPPDKTCIDGQLVDTVDPTTGHTSGFPSPLPPVAHTGAEAGAIPATFFVSDRGTANYTIPVKVPPGRAGMEPDISLTYSSTIADGIMGVGWSVAGFSKFERCQMTVALDGKTRPVSLDQNDPICLDGERLHRIAGELPTSPDGPFVRTHYTEVEDFRGIMAIGPEHDASGKYVGPKSFLVWKKDGHILTYGLRTDRRSTASNDDWSSVANTRGVHRQWNLSAIKDRAGNLLRIWYWQGTHGETTTEIVPTGMSYGRQENPSDLESGPWTDRGVRFSYKLRRDVIYHRVAGELAVSSRLLDQIETYADGKTVNRYRFEYSYERENPPDPPPNPHLSGPAMPAKLKKVTLCGGSGEFERCLPPTRFQYNDPPLELGSYTSSVSVNSELTYGSTYVMDWNGDGADELVRFKEGMVHVFATQWTSGGSRAWTLMKSFSVPKLSLLAASVMDVDRDGRDDLVVVDSELAAQRFMGRILRSTPEGFEFLPWEGGAGTGGHLLRGDVNGDGLQDIVEHADLGLIYVTLNTGFGFGPPIGVAYSSVLKEGTDILLIDRDGDGTEEILLFDRSGYSPRVLAGWNPSDQRWDHWEDAGFQMPPGSDLRTCSVDEPCLPHVDEGWSDDNGGSLKATDVNGDGLQDVVDFRGNSKNPARWRVWLSTGTGFTPQAGVANSDMPFEADPRYSFVADYDHDGRGDIVLPLAGLVLRGDTTGSLLLAAMFTSMQEGLRKMMAADVEADGNTEWVTFEGSGTLASLKVIEPACVRASLMSNVTDGLGKRVAITYGTTSLTPEHGIRVTYDPNETPRPNNGTVRLRRVAPLVSGHAESQLVLDASGAVILEQAGPRYNYWYEGAEVALGGRGWYGFRSRDIVELNDAFELFKKTTITFHNDLYWRRGLINEVREESNTVEGSLYVMPFVRTTVKSHEWQLWTTPDSPARSYPWLRYESTVVSDNDHEVVSATNSRLPDNYGFGNVQAEYLIVNRDDNGAIRDFERTLTSTEYSPDPSGYPTVLATRRTVQSAEGDFDFSSRTTGYTYYANGLPQTVTREPDSTDPSVKLTRTFVRDQSSAWNVKETVEADGNGNTRSSKTTYDGNALFPTFEENALGHVTEVAYDQGTGKLLTEMDPNGRVVQRRFDPFGRPEAEQEPNESIEIQYFPTGPLPWEAGYIFRAMGVRVASTVGWFTETSVDAYGRSIDEAWSGLNGSTIRTVTFREWDGKVEWATAPYMEGGATQGSYAYQYDALRRVTGVTWPDGLGTSYQYATPTTIYPQYAGIFASGAVSATVELGRPNRSITFRSLDHRQRPLQIAQADSISKMQTPPADLSQVIPVSTYEYAPFDEVQGVTDPDGDRTSFAYDAIGRKLGITNENTGLTAFTYNAFGDVTSHTVAGNTTAATTTCFTADALGRIREIRKPGGTDCSVPGDLVASYTYDQAGSGPPGDNEIGRLVASFRASTPESSSGVGTMIRYHYEPRPATGANPGRLQSVERFVPGLSDGFTGSLLTSFEYYDGRPELKTIHYPTANGQPFDVQYNYDSVGNVREVVDPNQTGQAFWRLTEAHEGMLIGRERFGNGLETHYFYATLQDSLACVNDENHSCLPGSLTQITTPGANPNGTPIAGSHYVYDSLGNVLQRTNLVDDVYDTFTYDHWNRLVGSVHVGPSSTDTRFDYSFGGDMRSVKTYATDGSPLSEQAYTYDPGHRHHLMTVGSEHSFGYDPAGRQLIRTTPTGTHELAYNEFSMPWRMMSGFGQDTFLEYDAYETRVAKRTPTETTIYAGDLYECVGPTPAPGEPMNCGEHRYKVYAGGKLVAQIGRDGTGQTASTHYVHADQLGSTTTLTDESGTVVERRSFDPFGDTTMAFGSTSVKSGYTGHEQDPELGLINMKGRLYDPKVRRFITPDPYVTDPESTQGLNRYAYVHNNPLNFVDPTGFEERGGSVSTPQGPQQGAFVMDYLYGATQTSSATAAYAACQAAQDRPSQGPQGGSNGAPGESKQTGGPGMDQGKQGGGGAPSGGAAPSGGTSPSGGASSGTGPGPTGMQGPSGGMTAGGTGGAPQGAGPGTPTDSRNTVQTPNSSSEPWLAGNQGSRGGAGGRGDGGNEGIGGTGAEQPHVAAPDEMMDAMLMCVPIKPGMVKLGVGLVRSTRAVRIGGRVWRALEPGAKAARSGCEAAARAIQRAIGGKIHRVTPPPGGARVLGGLRNSAGNYVNPAGPGQGWSYHDVVLKEGRVYDAFTGPEGLSIADYKSLWEYGDVLNFGF